MYYEAFTELSTCRSVGFGTGPILWTAINQYGMRHGFVGEGFEYLVRMVRALDDAFLAYSHKKAKAEQAREDIRNAGPERVREED